MILDYEQTKRHAENFYKAYCHEAGEIPLGDCPIIAGQIYLLNPACEIWGGYCFTEDDSGPHWWVEMDGKIIDPLGNDWIYKITKREREISGPEVLILSMEQQQHFRKGFSARQGKKTIQQLKEITGDDYMKKAYANHRHLWANR